MGLRSDLEAYLEQAREAIASASTLSEVDDARIRFVGKKGLVSTALRRVGEVPPSERPTIGKAANDARNEIEALIAGKLDILARLAQQAALAREKVDVTLPGRPFRYGNKHILQKVYDEAQRIFLGMGFEVAEGPEIESDYYNFVALNIPKDHPARDMQATFYFDDETELRTHTSPVQIRAMLSKHGALPVRLISPGFVYRRDSDNTHSPMFLQFEALAVDVGVTLGDLKGTIEQFAKQMFDQSVKIRLRPSYFPFTEPSAEADVSCTVCGGKGCRTCKGTGWLEILGSGMVHPAVLRNGGYDPSRVTGFALGMGIDRVTMLKYGLDDIRNIYSNDVRFLRQF
ncbi:MAG: phenylalanine--tRNA ligase subunit alpha [Bacillota bacterium]|nr:phenylalanine--tRNA ligase subunit alpha [Bacillota bacterium]